MNLVIIEFFLKIILLICSLGLLTISGLLFTTNAIIPKNNPPRDVLIGLTRSAAAEVR